MSDSNLARPAETAVLILVHGATANRHMWDSVRRELDPSWRILAPDLPGHGSRRGEDYTVAGAVATVVEAARSVAPAEVILVGDSLGGYTSLAAASALPVDQLKGIVAGGAAFNFIGMEVVPFVLRGWLFRLLIAVFGEQRLIEKSVAKGFGDGPGKMKMRADDLRALLDAGMSMSVWPRCVAALRGIDFKAITAAIPQPILFVNGDRDGPNVRHEPEFLAVARQPSSHRFTDCPHGVSLWRVKEFAGLVNDFARRAFTATRHEPSA